MQRVWLMKISRYNVCVDVKELDQLLVYNTLKKNVVLLKNNIYDLLQQNRLNDIDANVISELKELGFILENEIDEIKQVMDYFEKVKNNKKILSAKILTTYDCNFDCKYCYEKHILSNDYMSDEVATQICNFYEKEITHQTEIISCTFYGGEPLLNTDIIIIIAQKLNQLAKNKGLQFHYNIITNGYCFNEEIIKDMVSLKLKSVWITLDGPPEIHDIRRSLKNKEGTFNIILNNIKTLINYEQVSVYIGVNYDKENYYYLPRMLEILKENNLSDKLHIDFSPTQKTVYENEHCDLLFAEDRKSLEHLKKIVELSKEYGFNVAKRVEIGLCALYSDSNFVIDPMGNIFKCSWLLKNDEYKFGNVLEDNYERSNSNTFKSVIDWDICGECSYLPICGGGCRYKALVNLNDINSRYCCKGFFDDVWRHYLKLYYFTIKK